MIKESTIKIYETDDYSLFKNLLQNRDAKSEATIIDSIRKVGVILDPILVNEKYEIIDGQNRFLAFRALGLPVRFVVQEGLGIEECRMLNIGRTNWSHEDFAESFANEGNENYQRLMSLYHEFKKPLGGFPGICAIANPFEVGTSGGLAHNKIPKGTYKLSAEEYELAAIRLKSAIKLGYCDFAKRNNMTKRTFYACVSYIYQHQDVNAAEVIDLMNKYETIIPTCNKVPDQLKFIDEVINKHRRGANKVFLSADFQKRRFLERE